MNGNWLDVHGAGAQRSDPKVGDPADYPTGHGPQGDAIRIYNMVRLVRSVDSLAGPTEPGDSQCATFDSAAATPLTLPCVAVDGVPYRVGLNLVSDDPLRFAVDTESIQPIDETVGDACAGYPHGERQGLRLNCVSLGGGEYWAELTPITEAGGFEFELSDFGNR